MQCCAQVSTDKALLVSKCLKLTEDKAERERELSALNKMNVELKLRCERFDEVKSAARPTSFRRHAHTPTAGGSPSGHRATQQRGCRVRADGRATAVACVCAA